MLKYAPPHAVGNPSDDLSHLPPSPSGALYKKSGHLPLFPILILPPPLLTYVSTQIPHPPLPPHSLLSAQALTCFGIPVASPPFSLPLSSPLSSPSSTYNTSG